MVFEWREVNDTQSKGMTVGSIFPRSTKYFAPSHSGFMINDQVENLDALLEALNEEGVQVDPHREDYDYGRFAWIIDPEGNRIELWEPAEKITTRRSGPSCGPGAPRRCSALSRTIAWSVRAPGNKARIPWFSIVCVYPTSHPASICQGHGPSLSNKKAALWMVRIKSFVRIDRGQNLPVFWKFKNLTPDY